ncbi:MAG: transcription elongation factor GreA [Bacteroidota bacterium]
MTKITYVTQEGLNKMQKELEQLMYVERPSISRQIAEARDKGDLSENAEYDAAKDAQGLLELKIARLQEQIRNSRLIDESKLDNKTVQILSIVKIKNLITNVVMEYRIVSETEANLKEKKISISTPIARGLMGKKAGDIVEVIVPNGTLTLEILEISL